MADKKISQLTSATTPLAGTEVLPIVQSGSTVKVSAADVTAGRAVSASSLTLTGSPLAATSGGTGQSSAFTANAIPYASSTSALATSSALTFNGTEVSCTGAIRTSDEFSSLGGRLALYRSAGASYIDWASAQNLNWRTVTSVGGGGATARMTLGSTGDLTLSTGNLVVGTAGKGIDFSANTHAAGMTSELLNWYEQGTFTPTLQGSTGNPTPTYTAQVGTYTRIGNVVYVWIQVYTSAVSGGTGDLRIGDLPFSTNASYGARLIVTCTRVDFSATTTYVNAAVDGSSNKIYLAETNDNSNDTVVPISAWNAGAAAGVSISGFYFV
jgi:hypothetical protein